jgi:hypothetical protein
MEDGRFLLLHHSTRDEDILSKGSITSIHLMNILFFFFITRTCDEDILSKDLSLLSI